MGTIEYHIANCVYSIKKVIFHVVYKSFSCITLPKKKISCFFHSLHLNMFVIHIPKAYENICNTIQTPIALDAPILYMYLLAPLTEDVFSKSPNQRRKHDISISRNSGTGEEKNTKSKADSRICAQHLLQFMVQGTENTPPPDGPYAVT